MTRDMVTLWIVAVAKLGQAAVNFVVVWQMADAAPAASQRLLGQRFFEILARSSFVLRRSCTGLSRVVSLPCRNGPLGQLDCLFQEQQIIEARCGANTLVVLPPWPVAVPTNTDGVPNSRRFLVPSSALSIAVTSDHILDPAHLYVRAAVIVIPPCRMSGTVSS